MWHVYYRSWLRWKKRADEWLDVETAYRRHERRWAYSVLFADNIRPAAVLYLQGDTVRVSFIDYCLREWMIGHYAVIDRDRLFLTDVTYQTFRGTSDAFALVETHRFDEDGTVTIRERHFQTGFAAPQTAMMDVSRNWEPYPQFGDYESLIAMHWAGRLNAVNRGTASKG